MGRLEGRPMPVFPPEEGKSVTAAGGRDRCCRPAGADDRFAAVAAAAGDSARSADAVCSCPDLALLPPHSAFPIRFGNTEKTRAAKARSPGPPHVGGAPTIGNGPK